MVIHSSLLTCGHELSISFLLLSVSWAPMLIIVLYGASPKRVATPSRQQTY
jgi:hypothetical protein